MPSLRIKQINKFIKEELSLIISKEVELPSYCLATITKVETSADLKQAYIWLSILPIIQQEEALKILNRQRGDLQKILNTRLKTRNTPKIQFKIDNTEEKAERILRLLDTLKEE